MTTWGPTRSGHDARILHLGEPKVADHDLAVLLLVLVQQILGLQVSVHHALTVPEKGVWAVRMGDFISHFRARQNFSLHICDGVQNLPDEVRCVLLCVRTFFHDSVKQFAPGNPNSTQKAIVFLFYFTENVYSFQQAYKHTVLQKERE